ncbi:MAG: hypothetical protein ACK5N8_06025 [Alphaproteobacteria bacterium]
MKRSKQTKEKRQVEVKKLLEEGSTQREICEKLNVCLKTVNNDCKEIRSVEEMKTDSMVRDLARVAKLGDIDYCFDDFYDDMANANQWNRLSRLKNIVLMEFERRIKLVPTDEIIKMATEIIKLRQDSL